MPSKSISEKCDDLFKIVPSAGAGIINISDIAVKMGIDTRTAKKLVDLIINIQAKPELKFRLSGGSRRWYFQEKRGRPKKDQV